MTTLLIFEAFGHFGVLERSYHIVTGFFPISFVDRYQAELFAAWLTDWRVTNNHDPTEGEQERTADAVRQYLAPISGVDPCDVLSAAELLAGFLDSAPGRELRLVA